jgi:hypothetical protein
MSAVRGDQRLGNEDKLAEFVEHFRVQPEWRVRELKVLFDSHGLATPRSKQRVFPK